MWPGARFGAPSFIHYGKDGGRVASDNADKFVYAISNNGFWNGGDDIILARVRRADLPHLHASDWAYFTGGDGLTDNSWTSDLSQAKPVLSRPAELGWTAPVFVAVLNRYLLVSWYVTPTLMRWFSPDKVVYDFFEAEHPWGPWNFVSSFNDRFLVPGSHMYGPNLCAKYQEQRGVDVKIDLYTSGCPFADIPQGLYKSWRIPLMLKSQPLPHAEIVNDDDLGIRYVGQWRAAVKRGFHDYKDDVHYTNVRGDEVDYTFTGTGIEVLSEKFSDQGSFNVFLDGKDSGNVVLRQDNFPRLVQISVFSAQGLQDGTHTIRLVNASSRYVSIDAFVVYKSATGAVETPDWEQQDMARSVEKPLPCGSP
jgi:hypothetical protein